MAINASSARAMGNAAYSWSANLKKLAYEAGEQFIRHDSFRKVSDGFSKAVNFDDVLKAVKPFLDYIKDQWTNPETRKQAMAFAWETLARVAGQPPTAGWMQVIPPLVGIALRRDWTLVFSRLMPAVA